MQYWKVKEKNDMQYLFVKNISAFLDKALGNKKMGEKGAAPPTDANGEIPATHSKGTEGGYIA